MLLLETQTCIFIEHFTFNKIADHKSNLNELFKRRLQDR